MAKSPFNFLEFISHNPLIVALIGVILTVALTLYGQNLYENWKLKTQTFLDIKGSYQAFVVPTELFRALEDYSDKVSPDALEKIAPEITKLNNGINSTSYVLYRYLNDLQLHTVIADLKYVRGYWTFSIENKGTKKIENLALFVPFDGYYELTQNEATQSSLGKFDKNIEIGNIKPSNSIFIKVWSDHITIEYENGPYFSSFEEKPKVTFENGYKLVDFSKN